MRRADGLPLGRVGRVAEPNNGLVVGPVRLVVVDRNSQDGWRELFRNAMWVPVRRGPTELRVYAVDGDLLLADRTFSTHASAERARSLLAGLAGPDGTDLVDWIGELAALDG